MHMRPVNNIQSYISAPATQKKQKNKKKTGQNSLNQE